MLYYTLSSPNFHAQSPKALTELESSELGVPHVVPQAIPITEAEQSRFAQSQTNTSTCETCESQIPEAWLVSTSTSSFLL